MGTAAISGLEPRLALARRSLRRAVVDERDGPLPVLFLGLTVMVGVVDATTILVAHVFVAVMTGNVVFLGLAVAGADGFPVTTLSLALGGFVVGTLIGGRACRLGRSHRALALRNVVAVKAVIAMTLTLLVVSYNDQLSRGVVQLTVGLLACSMGCQLAAIRYLKVRDLPTVVLTLTLTGALTERWQGWNDPAALRRLLTIAAFFGGVVAGGLLVLYISVSAALGFGLGIIIAVEIASHILSRGEPPWSTSMVVS